MLPVADVTVVTSVGGPDPDNPTAWAARAYNHGTSPGTVQAVAICAVTAS